MYLTKQEERMLGGEYGWANQVAMKILVRLGDLFGSTKLIPIQSAHLSGVSYKHMGDAAIEFLDELANKGGKAKTQATLNPSSFDPKYLVKRYSEERFAKQKRINELYEKMHIKPTLTCTPYYLEKPHADQHLAWAESSAVVYANSVLHAWTNREGSPSALAAALIGKTPNYGVHQPLNREPNVQVKVETELKTETDYGALGIHLGRLLKDKIPIFDGLKASEDELKQLGAAMASSGMTSLFHTQSAMSKGKLETISVEANEIEETASSLCTTDQTPDLVFIGCPHCSIDEVRSIAQALERKKVRKDLELWICASRHVKERKQSYVDIIEHAGGHVLCDTCVLVSWIKDLGVHTLLTNSAKTVFYAPTLNEVEARFASMKECIKTACTKS
jgi:predicted aconitase